ncbi:unnamed protein product [Calypogeia fissa]
MASAVGLRGVVVASGGLDIAGNRGQKQKQQEGLRTSFGTGESSVLGFLGGLICGEKRISVVCSSSSAAAADGRKSVGVRASIDRIPKQFREEHLKEGCMDFIHFLAVSSISS